MAIEQQPPSPGDEAVTSQEIDYAERRVKEARERAAHAGFSAAKSFEESARRHERLARVQDESVRQGVSDVGKHRESAIYHRKAAAEDCHLAKLKREESEIDLAMDPDY